MDNIKRKGRYLDRNEVTHIKRERDNIEGLNKNRVNTLSHLSSRAEVEPD
jgi:hypothetical protein